jgi:pyruvate kinase
MSVSLNQELTTTSNSAALRLHRRAKIVATIGPASRKAEILRELIRNGLDVARINLSHGSYEEHVEAIYLLRTLSQEAGRPIAILLDLSGPKIRTGKLQGGQPVELKPGNLITITTEPLEGSAEKVSANYPFLVQDVRIDDRILLDDGLLELSVEERHESEIVCRVIHGGLLGQNKGINLPGVPLSIPCLTDKDRRDLVFGIQQQVDYIALSFVRSAKDCEESKALIRDLARSVNAPTPPLIAKIEKREALVELDEILQVADGIMVARGDLGVETSTESVPVYQKEMILKANQVGKLVITATQMLQSMIENPRPTRAEASDVANAILDGTDAVMLSGETASGAFPVESLQTMDRIVRYTEAALAKQNFLTSARRRRDDFAIKPRTGTYGRALAEAAVFAANEINSRLIVAFTEGGSMPQHVAALRPSQEILALTPVAATYRRLAAIWGAAGYLLPPFTGSSAQLLAQVDRLLLESNLVQKGENVVIVAGSISGHPLSDMVKLHRVGTIN